MHPLGINSLKLRWQGVCIVLIQSSYSGNPDGDMTMLMMSLIRLCFMTRSLGVVKAMEGDAFTCRTCDGHVTCPLYVNKRFPRSVHKELHVCSEAC